MREVFVVLGPTASGKTKLSVDLAREINGEIVSADSMQVYKYMDIGTAKPDMNERAGIKHYLVDEVLPDEEFSVARFKELSLKYINEILSKGKKPIVVGGTGLYINSLIYNIDFAETICDWDLRDKLKREADEKGNSYLHEQLKKIDPIAAGKIHENNVKRVIRAIEVYEHSKKTISYHQEVSRETPPEHRFIKIGLTMDRDKLYNRINKRVDIMFENGLIDEVKRLKTRGFDNSTVAMQGIGYKEVLLYLRGECTLEETKEIVKKGTRNYAKRQMTWFKKLENVNWIEVDSFNHNSEIIEKIKSCIETYDNI